MFVFDDAVLEHGDNARVRFKRSPLPEIRTWYHRRNENPDASAPLPIPVRSAVGRGVGRPEDRLAVGTLPDDRLPPVGVDERALQFSDLSFARGTVRHASAVAGGEINRFHVSVTVLCLRDGLGTPSAYLVALQRPDMPTTTIHVLLYDGFDELDAVAPFEVFQNAARVGADCTTSLVTHESTSQITASHGLRVEPDGVLPAPEDDDAPDLLVVPGGGWSSGENRGVRREYEAGDLPEVIGRHHEAGTEVASVCTGGMLLERAGVLDGRPAVTHRSALEDLRDAGVEVVERRVVDAGDVVTAGGVTSGIDLSLYLVGRTFGERVADEVAEILEHEASEDVLIKPQG